MRPGIRWQDAQPFPFRHPGIDPVTPIGDNSDLPFDVRQTTAFERWFRDLRDVRARAAVARRITRLRLGNFGDAKSLGKGLLELRIDTGPGYRVYLAVRAKHVVVLLAGGDKGSQTRDIERARKLAREL